MTDTARDWLYPLMFVACIFFALMARHHARKAADTLAAAKKLVANLWNHKEDGR